MICILNRHTDPHFNLAAEEYLLSNCREDGFMAYRNDRAVIIGRNQNPLAQVAAGYVARKRIPVIRRLSGGGAVYHDLGNVNFAFIRTKTSNNNLDYHHFMEPIVSFLQTLGIPAHMDGSNSICINGDKISGNAQYFRRGRILHHGTLLYDADLKELNRTLSVDPANYRGKCIDSIRRSVTNVRLHLPTSFSIDDFMEELIAYIQKCRPSRRIFFSAADAAAIEAVASEKYRHWQWNFGCSPPYRFCRRICSNGLEMRIELDVRSGIIQKARISSAQLPAEETAWLVRVLTGCRHDPREITAVLSRFFLQTGSAASLDAIKEQLFSGLF